MKPNEPHPLDHLSNTKYWWMALSVLAVILNTSLLLILVDLIMIFATSVGISTPSPVQIAETIRSYGNVILIASISVSILKYFLERNNAKN